MDELVRIGLYPNRSSVIRAAVRDLVRRELWDRGGGSYRRALNNNRST
jgi:Arc/MetJ-type ribon-helix-helix transcriptional regulator